MNPVNLRLLNQQLVAPQFTDPAELVSYMGAMQAQEYRLMRWSVMMRTRRPSLRAFEKAYNSGRIVRSHLHRGTWQLMAAEDYWWMLQICGPKGIAVTKGWMHSNHIDLSEAEIMEIREKLVDTVSTHGSATKEDIVRGMAERGVTMDDHRLSYHIRMSEFSGVLCSGDLLPVKPSYALVEKKIGPKTTFDTDEALMRLAGKYFQSHQPATLEDFVWWSSLGVNDCKRAIALLGDRIHLEKWKGYEFYVLDDCRMRGLRSGSTLLLPSYDEYLIGYKSREISLPPEFSHKAHNNSGIFYPVVVHEGRVCGNWSPSSPDGGAEFFSAEDCVMLEQEWERYRKATGR